MYSLLKSILKCFIKIDIKKLELSSFKLSKLEF